MKAVTMTEPGAPGVLVLEEVPEPSISDGKQIKVKLKAAGVNPIDTKIRSKGLFYGNQPPAILGCDGAGVITKIGEEVVGFEEGDEVWFCHGGLGREPGNYAEYNVLNYRWAALKPASMSFPEAAALPLVLITAWGGLYDRGRLKSGETVLIHAGAGGVGHVAIQLAKIRGARVLTTVNTEAKAQFVKQLGADEVIHYQQENVVESVKKLTGGQGADLVFDTVGPAVFKDSIEATAHFGRIVTLLDPGLVNFMEARLRNLTIGFELMLTPMLRDLDSARARHVEILYQCGQWFTQGRLQTRVESMPLVHAQAAHEQIEAGHVTGKIVLDLES